MPGFVDKTATAWTYLPVTFPVETEDPAPAATSVPPLQSLVVPEGAVVLFAAVNDVVEEFEVAQ